jgi:hypothetical protein
LPSRSGWIVERPNLVRERFLAELESWLTPSLLYHCFTGEDDPYRLAHIERLEPALQEPLLQKAEQLWPQRLAHIAVLRKTQQQESKAMVESFVQTTLVGANAEPKGVPWTGTGVYPGAARS